jgi:hypothetical protein
MNKIKPVKSAKVAKKPRSESVGKKKTDKVVSMVTRSKSIEPQNVQKPKKNQKVKIPLQTIPEETSESFHNASDEKSAGVKSEESQKSKKSEPNVLDYFNRVEDQQRLKKEVEELTTRIATHDSIAAHNKIIRERQKTFNDDFARSKFYHRPDAYVCKLPNCNYTYRPKPGCGQTVQSLKAHLSSNKHWPQVEAEIKSQKCTTIEKMLDKFDWGKSFPSTRQEDMVFFMLTFAILTSNIAFRFIENTMLVYLISGYLGIKMFSRRSMMRSYLPNICDTAETMTFEIIAKAKSGFTVSFDVWSSFGHAYMGVIVFFIDNDWKLKKLSIGCIPFADMRHTAVNIAKKLTTCINKAKINEKVVAIVSDSASSCSAAIKIMGLPWIPCS